MEEVDSKSAGDTSTDNSSTPTAVVLEVDARAVDNYESMVHDINPVQRGPPIPKLPFPAHLGICKYVYGYHDDVQCHADTRAKPCRRPEHNGWSIACGRCHCIHSFTKPPLHTHDREVSLNSFYYFHCQNCGYKSCDRRVETCPFHSKAVIQPVDGFRATTATATTTPCASANAMTMALATRVTAHPRI